MRKVHEVPPGLIILKLHLGLKIVALFTYVLTRTEGLRSRFPWKNGTTCYHRHHVGVTKWQQRQIIGAHTGAEKTRMP